MRPTPTPPDYQAEEAQWDLWLPWNDSMDVSTESETLPTHTTVSY